MQVAKVHFDNKEKQALCKQKSAYPIFKTEDFLKVTCKFCIKKYKRLQVETSKDVK